MGFRSKIRDLKAALKAAPASASGASINVEREHEIERLQKAVARQKERIERLLSDPRSQGEALTGGGASNDAMQQANQECDRLRSMLKREQEEVCDLQVKYQELSDDYNNLREFTNSQGVAQAFSQGVAPTNISAQGSQGVALDDSVDGAGGTPPSDQGSASLGAARTNAPAGDGGGDAPSPGGPTNVILQNTPQGVVLTLNTLGLGSEP